MYDRLKMRVYRVVEKAEEGDDASRVFDLVVMALIVVNVVAVMLETVNSLSDTYGPILHLFEAFSVVVFSAEYVLRLWSITSGPTYRRSIAGRLRFMLTPMAVVDLLAILPFYLPMVVNLDLRMLRALRLFRLFRVLKFVRYSRSLRVFGRVAHQKKEELGIILFILVIMLVIASSLMYFAEVEAQPEVFSSIPAAMWWGVVTLTTVGYGDLYPVTPMGKMLGTVIAILGIGLFALPAAILSSAFVSQIERVEERVCPHCGGDLTGHAGPADSE